jgi:hypothetical protein
MAHGKGICFCISFPEERDGYNRRHVTKFDSQKTSTHSINGACLTHNCLPDPPLVCVTIRSVQFYSPCLVPRPRVKLGKSHSLRHPHAGFNGIKSTELIMTPNIFFRGSTTGSKHCGGMIRLHVIPLPILLSSSKCSNP